MFKLSTQSVVYIVAPPLTASGGPELLHQLCYVLNQLNINAKMYYYDRNNPKKRYENPVNPRYLQYNVEYIEKIDDNIHNLLIVPETITAPLRYYSKIQKCVWWLRADTYFWFQETEPDYIKITLYHWLRKILHLPIQLNFKEILELNSYHLAQCWYIKRFLEQRNIPDVGFLSDYINDEFVNFSAGISKTKEKKNIILYNPKRKQKLIKYLKRKDDKLVFIPILKMSQNEIRDLMSSAKLYIDFGAHPGKDRMPREAALCGCCIITSTLGSAGYYEDIPISREYKFERKKENINAILDKIHYIMDHYEEETKKFDHYREFIKNEHQTFISDVKKLFCCVEE